MTIEEAISQLSPERREAVIDDLAREAAIFVRLHVEELIENLNFYADDDVAELRRIVYSRVSDVIEHATRHDGFHGKLEEILEHAVEPE